MAKIRITKPGETPNKKRFKRNVKLKKGLNYIIYAGFLTYILYKENLINIFLTILQ